MNDLRRMTVRELIVALHRVEDSIRRARLATPSTNNDLTRQVEADFEDIGILAAREQQIVHELRRRRRMHRSMPG